jgi:hypothetical protein
MLQAQSEILGIKSISAKKKQMKQNIGLEY